jgi:hypothetical protein
LPLLPPKYDAKILLIGGGTFQGENAFNDVEIIDFSLSNPKYQHKGHMKHSRYFNYAVILPDQSILILGGKTGKKGHHIIHPANQQNYNNGHSGELEHTDKEVLEPELYNSRIDSNSFTFFIFIV